MNDYIAICFIIASIVCYIYMLRFNPERKPVRERKKRNWNDKNPKKSRRKKKWGRIKRTKGIKRQNGKIIK